MGFKASVAESFAIIPAWISLVAVKLRSKLFTNRAGIVNHISVMGQLLGGDC
ncbi:MAG: hypothetical protein HYV36_07625 [Lentisphaerae bacterium]|nr:hypothetical protein [Lentisphaerota bacterium]